MMESFEPDENQFEENEKTTTNSKIDTKDETTKKSSDSKSQSILSLIKTLRIGIGMDVSRVPVPASLLSQYSMLTYLYDSFAKNFDVLLKANYIENDLERMLQVFKFMTMLCDNSPETSTKPLNPILGETQISQFKVIDQLNNDGTIKGDSESNEISDNQYCVEHISIEPPFSVACIYNKREGVKVYFNQSLKILFMGTYFKISFQDDFNIQFEKFNNEKYTIIFPSLCNRFLRNFSEYCGKSSIESNLSNFKIKSEFFAKPLFTGKYNYVESKVYNQDNEELFKINGQWDKEFEILNLKTNEKNLFFKRPPSNLKKFEKVQDPSNGDNTILDTDSSIVWKSLIEAHNNQDSKLKIKEKNKVEENEKKREIERKENNIEWKPIHFKLNENNNKWELLNFK